MARRHGIKITKGIRLNINKNGTSVTFKSKDIFGKTHSSTLPLTSSRGSGGSADRSGSPQLSGRYTFNILDNGDAEFFGANGQKIYDDSIIRKLKAAEQFREQKRAIMSRRKEEKQREQNAIFAEMQNDTDEMVNIYKMSAKVISKEDCKDSISNISAKKYEYREYDAPKPMKARIEMVLLNEAEQNVKAPFWKRKKSIGEYVNARIGEEYAKEMEKYEAGRIEFEKEEEIRAQKANARYEDEAEQKRNEIRSFMENDRSRIEQKVCEWLESLTLTVDFSVDYEYDDINNTMWLDLHLPPLSEIPTSKPVRMSNGTVKAKDKTQKEIKQEYILCTFGLAVFTSSYVFNVSTAIARIVVSGYSQRRDERTGNIIDDCLYTIKFPRTSFEDADVSSVDPQQFCLSMESRANITASLIMKPVESFEESRSTPLGV